MVSVILELIHRLAHRSGEARGRHVLPQISTNHALGKRQRPISLVFDAL
jgi:hypothetical protein